MVATNKAVAHADMRKMNMALMLDHLRRYAPLSRSNLAKMTGLNKATVSSIVGELIDKGFVTELGIRETESEVGHPSIDLAINPDAGRIIGAEIGVDFISVIIANLSPHILWRRFQRTGQLSGFDAALDRTQQFLVEAYQEARQSDSPVLGLGLAVPGLVDISTGTLLFAPYQGWTGIELRRLIEAQLDIPIFVGNEAHMAALGESYFGAARDSDHVLYLSAGYSLSGGIILDGNVLPGAAGLAGEVGHITLDPQGPPCNCGKKGCWETLASQQALQRRIREAIRAGQSSALLQAAGDDLKAPSMSTIVEAADRRDPVALQALEETGYWLGVGIANLVNIFNPELVVFGGTLSAAHAYLLPTIKSVVANQALPWPCRTCDITLAQHQSDGGVIGAIATVYWEILNHPQDWL